ncbi:PAS domain-containing sensor histidine kinase [Mucilaginibacter arboris]|uniref:histidine kinase n=1 Tax=Mucilaginibacter arboris TaxID=2682090 RepID=A0A7K1SYM8_9SPHI|nr:PAS domain-containing protein [Mucilaginibacter arboris]MVN22419.1 PAS domain-containing protein [Mucilaginibacter arboris]
MNNDKSKLLETLRRRAENLLTTDKNSIGDLETIEVKKVFHELQVHQLELEMQNDELQVASQELEQQRLKFTNLFELAPIGYFVTTKSGIIQDVNFAGLQLLQDDKNKLVGKPLLLHVHKDDRDIFYKYFRYLHLITQAQSCQIRLINTQNRVFNVQIEGIALHTATGPICYLTVTDFTGKQQADLELKEAKKRLEIALDASLTGIWEIDIVSGEIYLDNFCCSLFGFNPNSFDGKYDTLLGNIHPTDRKNVDDHIRKTITQEIEFNIKFRTQIPEGNVRYIQARAQIITDQEDKKRFIGTFTDISEKTILELEAAHIKEEQQQMILAAGLQAEENEKRRISEVLHNGIAQMLYAIKMSIGQVNNTDVMPLFEHINQLLNQSIKDIRNVSFELAPSILTDFGLAATLEDLALRLSNEQLLVVTKVCNINKDADFQLQLNIFRIIQELINNGIKHASASKIIIEVVKKNKTIGITVSDNGIGFKPDNNSTETPKGIGLSSIKNRLGLYKGTIYITSEPKKGTIVHISLKV